MISSKKLSPLHLKKGGRPGFSLVETALAAILLGILLAGWLGMLSDSAESTESHRNRSIAMNIAVSEAERLRVAGPIASTSALGERRVDASGALDPSGVYVIQISQDVLCDGGENPRDNSLSGTIAAGCLSGRNPTLRYDIRVSYPINNEGTLRRAISYEVRQGSWRSAVGNYPTQP